MKALTACLAIILLVAACNFAPGSSSNVTFETLPSGDAASGEALFTQVTNGAPSCSTCHTLDGSTLVGPSLQDYAANRQAHADQAGAGSLAEYTYNSIVQPSAFIVSGFSNAMYGQYRQRLSAQQIADLLAYLHTL